MKRSLFGALWLLALCAGGAGLLHHALPRLAGGALDGAVVGLLVFTLLAALNALPGARGRREAPRWGVAEAIWLAVNFAVMQVAGVVVIYLGIAVIAGAGAALRHLPLAAIRLQSLKLLGNPAMMGPGILFGYLIACWWALRYIRGAGRARLAADSAGGLGWRAAPGRAYVAAAAFAVLVVAIAVLINHVIPVPKSALDDSPLAPILRHSALGAAAIGVIALILGPAAEEMVFRGGMMGGLSPRLGVWAAAILVTLLFVALHAPEKRHYPPGFVDVGLMATAAMWLRVRYQSIRPGILLHMLYNLGVTIASATLG
jgi:membrane protease YdiL (CAAX protease family)